MSQKTDQFDFAVVLRPLSGEDGGGWLATVPALPGCMSDGETKTEALADVDDAIASWLETARTLGREVSSFSVR